MAAITTSAIGLASSGFQAYQGMEQKRKAQKALQDYDRQDLNKSNPYENIAVSTVGSDLMREESQRNSANVVDAMRNGGSRGIAMLPQVVANNTRANQESRSYLDDQINKRSYAIAGDQTQIRGMKEERENADIAGLGQQMQAGRQDMWSGIRGVGSSLMYAANNVDWSKDGSGSQADKDFAKMGGGGMSQTQFNTNYKPRYSSMLQDFNKI